MNAPHVSDLIGPPERIDALAAIARTIGLVRRRRALNAQEIANSLKDEDGKPPTNDTILRAEKRESLLSFHFIAQLAYLYADCADPIRQLLAPAPTAEATTLEERLKRAEEEILAVRRELVADKRIAGEAGR